jgi:hypothetical protein
MSRIKENTDYVSIFDDAVDEVTTLVQSSYKSFKTGDLHRLMVANLEGKLVYAQSDRKTAAKLLATQIDSSLLTPGVINGAARRNKVMQHMVTEFCHTILGVDGSVISMRDYTPTSPVDDGGLKVPRGWQFGRRGSKTETKKETAVASIKKEGGFGFFRRKSEDKEGKSEKQPAGKRFRKYSGGEALKGKRDSEPEGERKNSAPALLEHDFNNEESDVDDDNYPSTPDSLVSDEGPITDGPKLTLKILKRDDNEVSDNRGNTVEIPQRGVSKARLHDPGSRRIRGNRPKYDEAPRSAPAYGSRDQSLDLAIKKAKPKKSPPLRDTRDTRPSTPREREMRQVDTRFTHN